MSKISPPPVTYVSNVTHTSPPPPRSSLVEPGTPKMVKLSKRAVVVGQHCLKCDKVLVEGDVVLDIPTTIGVLVHHFPVHLECVKVLVDKAPEPQYAEDFKELRKKIIETGKAFPDEEVG